MRRSYARILRGNRWWYLISTILLFVLAMEFGLLLFVLPGLWLMTRGLFISIIVALEGRRNIDAIRRSIALTKGQVWRIAGLLLPFYVPIMVLSVVMVTPKPAMMAFVVNILGNLLILGVLSPAFGLAMVLLYYDQRVRRESYDAQALSEDLMR